MALTFVMSASGISSIASAARAAHGIPKSIARAVPPAKTESIFAPEKGKFHIRVGGKELGEENFEITPNGGNWIAHGNSEIQTADGMTHVSGTLELRPDGTPVKYEWATQGTKKASATIIFTGATASIELRMEGSRPYTQTFTFNSPQVVVLDNNLYHQYAVLGRLYDRAKKGPQTFAVLVPQELTPGTVTVESLGNQSIDGKNLEELRVVTEDLEVDLYMDGPRLIRMVAPSSGAEITRE
jgi:hypothetical protein